MMNSVIKGFLIAAGAIITVSLLLNLTSSSKLQSASREIRESFETISVETISSDIDLSGSDSSRLLYSHDKNIFENHIGLEGKRLFIKETKKDIFRGITSQKGSYAVFLAVYPQSAVLQSMSGNVSISDIKTTEVSITNTSGDIHAVNINCENFLSSAVSGGVKVQKASVKKLKIKTVSGEVGIEDVASESIEVEVVSGDISMQGLRQACDIIVKTTSGDVRIKGIDLQDYNVEFSSISGEVFIKDEVSSKGKYRYGVGDKKIKVESVSGDLIIE
jgi:DUF4097 and DUF4098 domain-containing protein YvlB